MSVSAGCQRVDFNSLSFQQYPHFLSFLSHVLSRPPTVQLGKKDSGRGLLGNPNFTGSLSSGSSH